MLDIFGEDDGMDRCARAGGLDRIGGLLEEIWRVVINTDNRQSYIWRSRKFTSYPKPYSAIHRVQILWKLFTGSSIFKMVLVKRRSTIISR